MKKNKKTSRKTASVKAAKGKPRRAKAKAKKAPRSATRIPTELLSSLERAVISGRYLVAVFHIERGQLNMFRNAAHAFPQEDHEGALRMLKKSLENLRNGG